ncbi:MAG: hypothetical protein RLZZ352_1477 [Pseudomonadota bacterium]|jgi:general secretion pathway protein C
MNKALLSPSLDTRDGIAPATAWQRLGPVLVAGLLWLMVGLSATYWVLLVWGRTPLVPVSAAPLALPVTESAVVARALGWQPVPTTAQQAPAAVAESSRYVLLGVVTHGRDQGVALIAYDGQRPRPYRVGAVLESGLVLQKVDRRGVRLGPALQGPTTVEINLPELVKPPSTAS